ncbi:hypothetical protein Fot_38509 [Forsythia ovata]|uniref:Uncharacterized protein n=1 Tax=Forsythia ovata TaxID=205694 RepID=A0ABD1S4M9_9LAMI
MTFQDYHVVDVGSSRNPRKKNKHQMCGKHSPPEPKATTTYPQAVAAVEIHHSYTSHHWSRKPSMVTVACRITVSCGTMVACKRVIYFGCSNCFSLINARIHSVCTSSMFDETLEPNIVTAKSMEAA